MKEKPVLEQIEELDREDKGPKLNRKQQRALLGKMHYKYLKARFPTVNKKQIKRARAAAFWSVSADSIEKKQDEMLRRQEAKGTLKHTVITRDEE